VFVASRYFEEQNHHLLDNPKLRVLIDDGRNFSRSTDAEVRRDLLGAELPVAHGLGGAVLDRVLPARPRAPRRRRGRLPLRADLPHPAGRTSRRSSARSGTSSRTSGVFSTGLWIIVLGREEPFPPIDVPELTRRVAIPGVAASLAEIGVRGPMELLSFYQFDEDRLAKIVDGAGAEHRRPAARGVRRAAVAVRLDRRANLEVLRAQRGARRSGGPARPERGRPIVLRRAGGGVRRRDVGADRPARRETEQGLKELLPVAESGSRFARVDRRRLLREARPQAPARGRDGRGTAVVRGGAAYEPDSAGGLVGVGYLDIFAGTSRRPTGS
jgi:hypothetical protein